MIKCAQDRPLTLQVTGAVSLLLRVLNVSTSGTAANVLRKCQSLVPHVDVRRKADEKR